jgi:hypothetical protein
MPRGRPPNLDCRRLAALLAEGLSQAETAWRLGVAKQAVSLLLHGKRWRPAGFHARCRECGHDLNPTVTRTEDDRKTFGPPCYKGTRKCPSRGICGPTGWLRA